MSENNEIDAELLASYIAYRDASADYRRAKATVIIGIDADTRERAKSDAAKAEEAAFAIALHWTPEELVGYRAFLAADEKN